MPKTKKAKILFAVADSKEADKFLKNLEKKIQREEAELVLYDETFLKDLAELAKILLGDKNEK
jgi:hypothetical protein